jgi:hypothetical protein
MAKIIPYMASQHFFSFGGFCIIIFLSKIVFVMQIAGMPHTLILDGEENFVEEVSETMCMSFELNIVQWIFFLSC